MRFNKKHLKKLIYQTRLRLDQKKHRSSGHSAPSLHNENNMPHKIVIWGCNEFSEYLHLLFEKNIDMAAFIDVDTTAKQFCGKPVYDPETFKSMSAFKDVPVLLATPHHVSLKGPSIDFESIHQFKKLLNIIINRYKIKNPVIHPSALIDIISSPFPNKVLAFGLQGSGNTLYNHILIKLIDQYPRQFRNFDIISNFFEAVSYEYQQCILQVIGDVISACGIENYHVVPWKIGMTKINFYHSQGEGETQIFSFATRSHITHKSYGYHEIPSHSYLSKLIKLQFKLFFIIRNPLDIIVSIIKKRYAYDANTKNIDNQKFCLISKITIEQLKLWLPYLSLMPNLKYEDVITNPIKQIMSLMKMLNLRPSLKVANNIWKEVGFKQLPNAPENHFKGGGSNKWEKFFTYTQLRYLQSQDIESVLRDYGYLNCLQQFRKILDSQSGKETSFDMPEIHFSPNCCTIDELQETSAYLEAMLGKDCLECSGPLLIASKNKKLLEKTKQLIDNDYIHKLVLAGHYPGGSRNNDRLRDHAIKLTEG